MSAAGLPQGGAQGYALLDKQGITASEFRQRVDYQRALEGELARTITAIDGVEAAKVHLVIPEEDLFSDDERQPTASVLVKTKPGSTLDPGQVQAVVHLVSSSVEGLVPEQVTVADDQGTMLAAPGEDGLPRRRATRGASRRRSSSRTSPAPSRRCWTRSPVPAGPSSGCEPTSTSTSARPAPSASSRSRGCPR